MKLVFKYIIALVVIFVLTSAWQFIAFGHMPGIANFALAVGGTALYRTIRIDSRIRSLHSKE